MTSSKSTPPAKCDGHISKTKIECKNKEQLLEDLKNSEPPADKNKIQDEKFEFGTPRFIRVIGPRQIEAFRQFLPGIMFYSLASFLGILYFAEWKAVAKYIPYYGGKYKNEEEED